MALRSPTVSRQTPRTRPTAPQYDSLLQRTSSMENERQSEAEEPSPVPTVASTARLTVNGIAVKRLQIDFGSNATAFHPSGSVMERFWDQYDGDPDKDKYSRPRAFCAARIEVDVSKGFMDLIVSWPDHPSITRLVVPQAHLNYEPL